MTKVSRFIYEGQLHLYGKSTKELSQHLPIHAFIMKHICLLIAFLFSTIQGFSQTPYPPLIWAAEVNTVPTDSFVRGIEYLDIAADPLSGGVYAVVNCNAPSTFDSQVIITPNPIGKSLALVKYDYQGNLEWLRLLGFVGYFSSGARICTSPSGDIFLSSPFSVPEVDFGNGVKITRFCNLGCDEVFVVKFSANGQAEWAQSVFGNESSYFRVSGIETDNSGNLFLLGNYASTRAVFGPNFVYNNLQSTSFYFARYDAANGSPQAVQFAAQDTKAEVGHLAVNNSGQTILTGSFFGTLEFESGLSIQTQNNVGASFVASLAPNGDAQWAKIITSSDYLNVLGIDIDEEGQAYLAIDASFDLKLDYNNILSISETYAGIVLKVGASEFSIPVVIEYNAADYTVMDVELDNWGNIYTAGYTSESVEISDSTYAIDGCLDGLLTATSSEGLLQWVRTIGGAGCETIANYDQASCIAFDGAGFLHTTGLFVNGFEEDGISVPGTGGFVAKFNTSIVDTQEPASIGNLQINPNPNAGSFVLNLDDAPSQNTLLQIHDLHGRLVFAQEIQSTQQEINTVLPAGAYIVTLQADKLLARQKLIVQR